MRFPGLLILLALLASPAIAQYGWFVQNPSSAEYTLFTVGLASASKGVVAGQNGKMFYTANGGNTWTELPALTAENFRGLKFYNVNIGVAVGNNGIAFKTTTGGATWTPLDVGTGKSLFDVGFLDEDNWFIVGQAGLIMRTTDGGTTFDEPTNGVNNYNAIAVRDSLIVVVGNKGVVRYSRDAGNKWRVGDSGIDDIELWDVSIGDDSTVIAVGGNGNIVRSEDGGETYTDAVSSIPISSLRVSAVHHLTRERAVAVLYGAVILETTDTGKNWFPQAAAQHVHLEDVDFIDEYSGNAVGWNGLIIRTNSGGLVSVDEVPGSAVPASPVISDMYPNPFSVSTHATATVDIATPLAGQMRLELYNTLGQRVRTVAERQLDAGTWQLRWDASSLPAGQYLYRLTMNGQSSTKRLIVLP